MSQAFVKEGDSSEDLPERPLSDRPNYVTAAGHSELRRRRDELARSRADLVARRGPDTEAELKRVERDLRYFEARLRSAIEVKPPGDAGEARFGATIDIQEGGQKRRYLIVGEDEADPARGKLSWCSPLALAMMGAKAGDEIDWEGPQGPSRFSVVAVTYP